MSKVTFDGMNRLIIVDPGITDLDVKIDLYSDWKEWVKVGNNSQYSQAMRATGGDPLPGSKSLGSTFFLMNGWRIRPYEGSHTLNVNGNLYTEEGVSPYVSTLGVYNVMIISTVSSLVDSTVQQLPEIEYGLFQDAVHIDATSGFSGTTYPTGTPAQPVDNLADAISIATARGFTDLHIIGNFTFGATDSIAYYRIIGEGMENTTLTFTPGCVLAYCTVRDARIQGQGFGIVAFERCHIHNYQSSALAPSSAAVRIDSCMLCFSTTMPSNYTGDLSIINCYSSPDAPTLDLNGAAFRLAIRGFTGRLIIENGTNAGFTDATIDMTGEVTIANSCTAGTLVLRGTGEIIDQSAGMTLDTTAFIKMGEVEYSSFGGAIHIDQTNGIDSSVYPSGTPVSPCKTMANVAAIRAERGFTVVESHGPLALGVGVSIGLTYRGTGSGGSGFTTFDLTGHEVDHCIFEKGTITGAAVDGSDFDANDCDLEDLSGVVIKARDCILKGTIQLSGGDEIPLEDSNFYNCTDGVPGSGTPIVSVNTSNGVGFWNYSGGLKLTDITTVGTNISVNFAAGRLIVDSSSTEGSITVRGIGSLVGTTGGTTINQDGLLDRTSIANGLLDLANGVESGLTTRAGLRLAIAALLGKVSGAPAGPIVFRDTNDTKDRITADVDSFGNRLTVTLDPS
jgi:hypothetical protein